jgi:hypothetical protein
MISLVQKQAVKLNKDDFLSYPGRICVANCARFLGMNINDDSCIAYCYIHEGFDFLGWVLNKNSSGNPNRLFQHNVINMLLLFCTEQTLIETADGNTFHQFVMDYPLQLLDRTFCSMFDTSCSGPQIMHSFRRWLSLEKFQYKSETKESLLFQKVPEKARPPTEAYGSISYEEKATIPGSLKEEINALGSLQRKSGTKIAVTNTVHIP